MIHSEAGVHYTFDENETFGLKRFEYLAHSKMKRPAGKKYHLGRDNGPIKCKVWCRSESDFLHLLEHWSRTIHWKYTPAPDSYSYDI